MPLRQQGLAELLAAQRPADEQPLARSPETLGTTARLCPAARPTRTVSAHWRRGALAVWHAVTVHVVIMGCGRVGSTLARGARGPRAHRRRHRPGPDAFQRLPEGFHGQTVTGVGFDREVLLRPGIERGARLRRGEQRRQLQHPRRAGRPRDVRRRQRGRPHLRPGPGRGLPAAGHPDRGDRARGPPTRSCAGCCPRARDRRARPHRRDPARRGARQRRLGRPPADPASSRPPAPGSPSSPASARASCRRRTPSSRRATCCTCSCADRDLAAVEAVLAEPPVEGD